MYLVYIPLIVYLLIVFLVPFFLKRDNGSDESYYLAGRSLGVRSSFLSLVATETSVATVLIFPAAGYNGKWNLLSLCIGYILGRCMVALHYLPTIYRMTDTSIYKAIGS
ncbi:MAG: sodium:solute symporter, partial [Leptospiraceae bacterium]|nr:sodium:solute symporter [Leptospiraceae bacterium]